MQRSTERILVTHTGSLPRSPELTAALAQRDRGEQVNGDLPAMIREGVRDIVARQVEAGITVVNDGEASKIRYATYVKERLDGFGGQSESHEPDPYAEEFPDFAKSRSGSPGEARPACIGPIAYRDMDAVHADIANLRAAVRNVEVDDVFMTAASPGIIAGSLENRYYPSDEAYLYALADVMKTEYDEIHRAGFVLQLDCPDLTSRRHLHGESLEEYRRRVQVHIDALNHATRDIPGEAMRLHVCWGNEEAPHVHDVALGDIIDLLFEARPSALSFEAANPRHAHEWVLFEEIALPDNKVLIPGVVDSTTNYVEHPELVAQRIVRYAQLVGRENVIAGSDCGFATLATAPTVYPTVTWAKLRALADGARRASEQLWPIGDRHNSVSTPVT
ncbi:MAG TPA: cobalamin-independent methionine synthase II family protein [Thermomicrobiales bacterium]|nr:cobalamin-independent methionine synthase II family protein [Thermomicrobiales bacterium]